MVRSVDTTIRTRTDLTLETGLYGFLCQWLCRRGQSHFSGIHATKIGTVPSKLTRATLIPDPQAGRHVVEC